MRMDFSSDGNWIRAEARAPATATTSTSVTTTLLSASSGEVSEDKSVSYRASKGACEQLPVSSTVRRHFVRRQFVSNVVVRVSRVRLIILATSH